MKTLKFIVGIVGAVILLIISLIAGVIFGLFIGFSAWNGLVDKIIASNKLRKLKDGKPV